MIPIIGLIIGLYTCIRFISFAIRPNEPFSMRVLNVIALLVTVLLMWSLLTTSSNFPQ